MPHLPDMAPRGRFKLIFQGWDAVLSTANIAQFSRRQAPDYRDFLQKYSFFRIRIYYLLLGLLNIPQVFYTFS